MAKAQEHIGLGVLGAVIAGVALRIYFVIHAPLVTNDTLIYGDLAKNLLERHVYGFTVPGGVPRPTLIRVPGYPLFLAACFLLFGVGKYQAVLWVQLLIDLLTCCLMADLARRAWGSKAGVAALWLAMCCPFTANYVGAALTETLSLFCIAAAFYGLARWRAAGCGSGRWLWVVAGALAYAVLLRPEQGLLAAAVVPAMFWMAWFKTHSLHVPARHGAQRPLMADQSTTDQATSQDRTIGHFGPATRKFRSVAPVLAAAVCVVLPLVPWAIRNERVFHVFQPIAPRFANDPGEAIPLGFQRWYRTWAIEFASTENVYWNYDGSDISVADLPERAFDTQEQYERTAELLSAYDKDDNPTPELDLGFGQLARERIANDPARYYLALPVARLADMLLRPRTELMGTSLEWWKSTEDTSQRIFGAAYAGVNLGYLVLGGTGLALWWRGGQHRVLLVAMVAYVGLRCALLLTIDNSEPRYTLEFFPILWVLGAQFWRFRSSAQERRHDFSKTSDELPA